MICDNATSRKYMLKKNLNSLKSVLGKNDQGVYFAFDMAFAGNRAGCFCPTAIFLALAGSWSSSASSSLVAGSWMEVDRFMKATYCQMPFRRRLSPKRSDSNCDALRVPPFCCESSGASSYADAPELAVDGFGPSSSSPTSASRSSVSSLRGLRRPPKRRFRKGIRAAKSWLMRPELGWRE